MNQQLIINDQQFILHASGAVYWPVKKALMLADLHLGKVTHFRKHGAAVPLEVMEENYRKLHEVLATFDVSHLYFLGDLFHSSMNREWDRFKKWIETCTATVSLIEGNHDIISAHRYEALGIQVIDRKRIDGFWLSHHPEEAAGLFNFCGHIHPGIRLQGLGRQQLKLSCFYQSRNQMILPAFGAFTGKHIMRPKKEDKVYVIADNEVILVK